MKFLSFRTQKQAVFIADIDGASAGTAIAHVSGNSATIMAADRSVLRAEERPLEQTASQLLSLLQESAQKTLALYTARAEGALPLKKTFAIVHSPWSRSRSAHRETEYEKDTSISPAHIAALATEALQEDTGLDGANLIEATIVRTELNGYESPQPKGKRARRLGVSVLMSDCNSAMRTGISDVLGKTVPGSALSLRSGARALLSALRQNGETRDCVVVSMTGDATDFLVIRGESLGGHAAVPFGTATVLRRIGNGKLPEETQALLRMASGDACTDAACEELNRTLAAVEQDLVKECGGTLAKLATAKKLPNALYLLVHPDFESWLTQFFPRIDFGQFTLTTRPFEVKTLVASTLSKEIEYVPGVLPDTALSVAVALVNSELKSD